MRYLKSATVGVTGSVLASVWAYSTGLGYPSVALMGKVIPLWAFAGGLMFATSLAADIIHERLLPALSHNEKFVDMTSSAVNLLGPAGTSVLAVSVLNSSLFDEIPMATVAMAAAGSELLGCYSYNSYVEPMYSKSY